MSNRVAVLLWKYQDVIALNDNDQGCWAIASTRQMHFLTASLLDDYTISSTGVVRGLIDDMLSRGIIEPCCGPWASPIVLVKKKDGSTRFCVDFRRVNDLTRKDAQPLPRIDDTLGALGGAFYFSSLDLAGGYWQVEVDSRDRDLRHR